MKRLFHILLLLLVAISAKATTLTGTFKLPDGTLVNGTFYARIVVEASQSSAGGCGGPALIVPGRDVTYKITNGALPGGATLVGNDCLAPAKTYYLVKVVDNFSTTLFADQWSVTGASLDVGTVVTANGTGFNGAVLLAPVGAGDQAIASNVLASGARNLGSLGVPWTAIYGTTVTAGTFVSSSTVNPAAAGTIKLATSDVINFRNFGLSADVNGLSKNASDVVVVGGTAGILTSGAITSGGAVTYNGFIQSSSNPAASGSVRMGNADTIVWRANNNLQDASSIASNASNWLLLTGTSGVTIGIGDSNAGGDVTIKGGSVNNGGVTAGSVNLLAGQALGSSQTGGSIFISPSVGTNGLPDGNVVIQIGIMGNGLANNGYKHARFGATCATTAVAGNTCTTTYTWAGAFNNANYTPVCMGVNPTGTPILSLSAAQIAASITVKVTAATAVASSFAGVDCQAPHD